MSSGDDPVRWRDDATAPGALRAALGRAAATPPVAYDTARGLERFAATLAADAGAPRARTRGLRWGAPVVGLAALLCAFGGARVAMRAHERAAQEAAAARSSGRSIGADGAPVGGRRLAEAPPSAPTLRIAHGGAIAIGQQTATPIDPASHPFALGTLRGRASGPGPARLASVATSARTTRAQHATRGYDAGVQASLEMLRAGREAQQLEWANGVLDSDPARALALMEAGDREFPGSARREERDALTVRALVRLRRFDDARTRATQFLAQWPRGAWSATVRQLLVQSQYAARAR